MLSDIELSANHDHPAENHISAFGCHYHHCDAAVVTNQIAIRKKRASLGQDGNGCGSTFEWRNTGDYAGTNADLIFQSVFDGFALRREKLH